MDKTSGKCTKKKQQEFVDQSGAQRGKSVDRVQNQNGMKEASLAGVSLNYDTDSQ